MKAKPIAIGVLAVVTAFAVVAMTVGAVRLSPLSSASDTADAATGADASGHPNNETNGVPPGPVVWLNDSAPYGPPEWYNESGGPPTWLIVP